MCVLVVEDDPLIRMMLVDQLEEAGLTVREAATGDAAVRLLNGLDIPLKVLVTDIHMPGRRNGVELAAYVKDRLPDVPIIFTTGRPDVMDGLVAPNENQELVKKPYSFANLVARVQILMDE